MDWKLCDLRSFNSICRACMKNDSLTSIFVPSKKYSLKLSEMLRYCTEVEVNEGDNLPSLICKQCISILVLLYEFKCNVRNSDAIFKQIMINTNINDNADLESSNNPILSTSIECNNIKLESTNEVIHYVNDLYSESTNLDDVPKTETRLDGEETCTNNISKMRCDIPKSTKRKVKRVDATQCEVCGKIFNCRSKLIQHMRKHTGEKPFSCDLCEKKFARAEHVAIHRRIHTGERPYTCTVCQKTFVQYAALTAHLRIHSGERPYMCTICGKSFSQSVSLVYHTRTHTGETPFKCKICNKGFTHSGNLKIHMRFHRNERPFVCNVCGRRFVTSSHLTVHIKKHTGDRPYKCDLCGKAFARSQHLKDHLVSHSGQKPYACKLCPKRYTQSGHLTRHMKTHRS